MAYESKSYELLLHGKNKVAIEINFQQWIHKVKENRHPISLYRAFGFVITDDAGY
jgi:adenosine deaminase/adenosine deaminase CECR1